MTPEALAGLLQLPAGAYIDHVETGEELGVLRLRVRGAGWPVRPGSLIPAATSIIHETYDADGNVTLRRVVWSFPAPAPEVQTTTKIVNTLHCGGIVDQRTIDRIAAATAASARSAQLRQLPR